MWHRQLKGGGHVHALFVQHFSAKDDPTAEH
jgi:hypothetical protein